MYYYASTNIFEVVLLKEKPKATDWLTLLASQLVDQCDSNNTPILNNSLGICGQWSRKTTIDVLNKEIAQGQVTH